MYLQEEVHTSPLSTKSWTYGRTYFVMTGDNIMSNIFIYNPFFNCETFRAGAGVHKLHDDVIKWKHFPRYWPFVRGIHRSPVNSPHKGQWRRALMFSLICAWLKGWVNNGNAGNLRRRRSHYDANVMFCGRCMRVWPCLMSAWWVHHVR